MKILRSVPIRNWVLAGCGLLIVLGSGIRIFRDLDLLTYDLRMSLRPTQPVADSIVLIQIDDGDLQRLGGWPFPRNFHASLVDTLNELGARAIVFDILFAEPNQEDDVLAESLKRSGNVYLASSFQMEDQPDAAELFFRDRPVLTNVVPKLGSAARAVGHVNALIDRDGKNRAVPLFIRSEGRLVPQLALRVAGDALGLSSEKVELHPDRAVFDGALNLPTAGPNALLVNFPGRWKDTFRHASYFDILQSYQQMQEGLKPKLDLSFLRGAFCFVGLTATGTVDIKPVPLENRYPMVGLHASILNSILTGKFIREAGVTANAASALLLFFVAVWNCLNVSPGRAFLRNFALGLIYFLATIGLFVGSGVWLDLVWPLSIVTFTYGGCTSWRVLEEVRRRQIVEKELEIARSIQQSFLPQGVPAAPGLAVAAFFQPAKFVAGDLFDVAQLEDRKVGIFIGDVAGKGVSAALIMAQTISLFRIFARQSLPSQEVLGRINEELCGRSTGRFVTALYAVVDVSRRTMSVSSAGQGPLLIYRKNEGKIENVELKGNVPLGLMSATAYTAVEVGLSEGDRVTLVSDGILEARNINGDDFGTEAVAAAMLRSADGSVPGMLWAIKDSVLTFSAGAEQHDDITLLVFSLEESPRSREENPELRRAI